jgi:hypothetical protein
MNGAIRREEKRDFRETQAGRRTSRWLDQISDLMGSQVGISSKRNVSKTFCIYINCIYIFPVLF